MKTKDPAGQTWRIRRRWLPWRRRARMPDWLDSPLNGVSGMGDDPLSMLLIVLALVVALPVLLLALVISLELLLLFLLLPLFLLARIMFGHAWVVEVRRGWSLYWAEPSGNWTESGERMRTIAGLIERGQVPPRQR